MIQLANDGCVALLKLAIVVVIKPKRSGEESTVEFKSVRTS